jgi:hypothetical protein
MTHFRQCHFGAMLSGQEVAALEQHYGLNLTVHVTTCILDMVIAKLRLMPKICSV